MRTEKRREQAMVSRRKRYTAFLTTAIMLLSNLFPCFIPVYAAETEILTESEIRQEAEREEDGSFSMQDA